MLHLDGEVDFGKSLQVCVGPDEAQRIVFDGVISAIEVVFDNGAPPLVVVLAEDALMTAADDPPGADLPRRHRRRHRGGHRR